MVIVTIDFPMKGHACGGRETMTKRTCAEIDSFGAMFHGFSVFLEHSVHGRMPFERGVYFSEDFEYVLAEIARFGQGRIKRGCCVTLAQNEPVTVEPEGVGGISRGVSHAPD
jgi:hypothetical protein